MRLKEKTLTFKGNAEHIILLGIKYGQLFIFDRKNLQVTESMRRIHTSIYKSDQQKIKLI